MKTSWFQRNRFFALSSMALAATTLTGCGAEVGDAHGDNEEVASTSQALAAGPTFRPTNAVTSALWRGDEIDAITTTTGGNQIGQYELKPTGWAFKNLTTLTGAPSGPPSNTFVRSDGRTDVLFAAGGHIRDISLWNGTWTQWDLTAITGAPGVGQALPGPRGYVRSDGVSAIVWASADKHIRELSLQSGGWVHTDLTVAAGYTPIANINFGPTGYVRGDGVTAVVFCDEDGKVNELSRSGSSWIRRDLTAITGASACHAGAEPFVRPDGVSSIVYISRGTPNQIWNLTLQGGVWRKWNLTALLGAPPPFTITVPVSYVRGDGKTAILYLTEVNRKRHIHELTMSLAGVWSHSDLTVAAGAPPVNTAGWFAISANQRSDGTSQVLFRDNQNHLRVIYRANTTTTWSVADLTQMTGANP